MTVDVVVVGSVNVDLSIPVDRLPAPGATVLGGNVLRGGGGKGANQAVAAARLGASVALVGRVGRDDQGAWLRGRLADEDVALDHLVDHPDGPTGLALVMVDGEGENSIVVSPGANGAVCADDLDRAAPLLQGARVVLTQLEIPVEVALDLPDRTAGTTVLNPAPAPAGLDRDALARFDVIVPNRGELAALAGGEPTTDPTTLVDQALALGAPSVAVTLGAQGALVVRQGTDGVRVVTVPAAPVRAVDTTAAGDAFCGALAVALAEGADLVDGARWAVEVAGRAVTVRGAQDALPHRRAVGSWEPTVR